MTQQQKNRLLIIGVFALSIIPLLSAWFIKNNTQLLTNTTNNGHLITPVISTQKDDLRGIDDFSSANIKELTGHWLIVNIIPNSSCNAVCLEAILKTKQLRLMLNKDLSRTRRVALVFNNIAKTTAQQWWLKDSLLWRLYQDKQTTDDHALFIRLHDEEYPLDEHLITRLIGQENRERALRSDLIRVQPTPALINKINLLHQGSLPEGMLFLIDPLGNLMMQYEPGFDPYKVKNDLLHLLKISQIG